jgi:SAM-dependent methyltransferase
VDSASWDQRYADAELVWSVGPNRWVEEIAGPLPAGRVLDVAAGEGRNALWLAERGWRATAVDFSSVALERARSLAGQRLGDDADRLETVHADLVTYEPEQQAYDLVVVAYLQVPEDVRRPVLQRAASAVAPGGRLLVVAHDRENLMHGYGGPSDPVVLYSAADVVTDISGSELEAERVEVVRRPVDTDAGPRVALDALFLAVRPETGGNGS